MNIPFISLSKENLQLIKGLLTREQAGEIFQSLYSYIYEGVEPTFNDKITSGVFDNIIMVIDRKAEGYFKKTAVGKKNLDKVNAERKTSKTVQVENEIVDTETGEIITDNKEEEMKSLRDTPQEIRNLFNDKYPEQYLELRSMFLDKHDDSEKPQLNERFNELCRMYDIEPDKNSKRIIKGVIEEFEDRISERKALEKQIETTYSSSEEVVEALSEETEEPVDNEKESIIVAYLNDRPWIMKQGQSYQCFRMGTPSIYDFMYDNGISESEFERVYKRIVSVR